MTVLVAVPYFGCPDEVERCVRSILGQTVRDIAVLVMGDGETPPLALTDDRLDVVTFRENRGPYYLQQVALEASPFDWYAPIGADDWIEPDHIERLLQVGADAVATGAVWFHDLAGSVHVHEAAYEVGLFRTERIRSIGGHNASERMGQDTLMLRLLALTGDLRHTTHPTYHRVKRPNSLMTSPWTGKGTPARNDMRRRNRIVMAKCLDLVSPHAIKAFRHQLVPQHIHEAVARDADTVRARLAA